jgi:hypothetical protein
MYLQSQGLIQNKLILFVCSLTIFSPSMTWYLINKLSLPRPQASFLDHILVLLVAHIELCYCVCKVVVVVNYYSANGISGLLIANNRLNDFRDTENDECLGILSEPSSRHINLLNWCAMRTTLPSRPLIYEHLNFFL